MNTKKIYFPLMITALFMLLSSNTMALDIPSLPGVGGTGGGSTPAPASVVIFTCNNTGTATNTSSNSSCSSSGSSSSSCSSGPGSAPAGHIKGWEMTSNDQDLKTLLNNPDTTCSEAVEAVGFDNCKLAGGDTLTSYTCKH